MKKWEYTPSRVCCRAMQIETENEVIKNVRFVGGCMGNTQGLSALLKGMTVADAIARLEGIQCGNRGTSCPDQLAQTLKESLK